MRWDAEKYDSAKAPQVDAGRELLDMARICETDYVLDIGCGTGNLTVEVAHRATKGGVVGIDPSEEMLEKARKVSAAEENVRLMRASAQSMSFINTFDLAFSNSALQWVREQGDALRLVHKALKEGGRIAFQLPAKNFCREFFDYSGNAIALLGFERFFLSWEQPWFLPTREEYEGLLRAAGFGGMEVFYRDYNLVFGCVDEVIEWWASAGMRPYLAAMPEKEQEYFKYAVAMDFEHNRTDRGIEFGFRRLFALAGK
ncbi:MAG TPA: methyltransferase domain-containing protein [Dissulfurispiraceae bacterium]